jgi:hypothetical protein
MRAFCIFTLALLFAIAITLTAHRADAHGMRTAYIELREHESGEVHVTIRTGASYGSIRVVMPEGCALHAPSIYTCTERLAGSTVRVEGLGPIVADAVIIASLRDGTSISALVRANSSHFTIPPSAATTARGQSESTTLLLIRYIRAGFFHVLAGADHLLFLAALVLALRRFRAVVIAESAFTISHSIAFSAAALGVIHVPARVAEAAIALSLVLIAIDLRSSSARPGRGAAMTMTTAAGARTAFVFGAVHGLGFAGGLQELGIPRHAILPALIGFAGGVEIAQVFFLLGCFVLLALARRIPKAHRTITNLTGYAVGITGVFWLIDRSLPFFR